MVSVYVLELMLLSVVFNLIIVEFVFVYLYVNEGVFEMVLLESDFVGVL